MKTLQMYVELQAMVSLFLVAFFWVLQRRLERHPFFRLWTLGWLCFGGFLLSGAFAMRISDPSSPWRNAAVFASVLLGYLQIPLILLGAQSLSQPITRRRLSLAIASGFAAGVLVLVVSYALTADPHLRYSIRSTPRQLGFALAYLYCSYLFFRYSRNRASRVGSMVTALSCFVGGAIQLMFSWWGLRHFLHLWGGREMSLIPGPSLIGVFWLNLDIAWECGVALGMILVLLEDYQAANRALRASEEKFSKAFRSSPDMISLSRLADGKELEVNDSFLQLSGYAPEEVVGRTAYELNMWVQPTDRVMFLAALRESRHLRDLEIPFRRKDGALGVGLVSAEIIEIEGIECLLTVTRDITARKRAEDALRWIARGTSAAQRPQFFAELGRHLAEALQVRYTLISECSDPGRTRVRAVAFWDGVESRQGFEYDLKGTPCEAVMAGQTCHFPEKLPELFPEDAALARLKLVGYVGVPLVDSAGAVIGHLAIFDDKPVPDRVAHSTTLQIFAARAGAELERETAERALRASEASYRELFENAKDMIYTHDLQGRVTSLNKAGEVVTGYSRDEAVELDVHRVIAPEYLEMVQRMLSEKLQGATHSTYEVEILTKDQRRVPLEVNTRVIYREDQPVAIQGIARDISERRSLEDQLRQAQKMEAIGSLAGGVAHDFNNLLMVIRGYSDLVLQRLPEGHSARRSIEHIASAGERASALTRQLLAFSRKQVLQPRILDLNELLLDLSKMLPRLIREDIEFVLQPGAGLGKVKADPTQIEQVVINLVVNARDAMPRGGKLTLETANVQLDRAHSWFHPEMTPGNYVLLAVSDTGIGMDGETQKRIFEPFFTTKPQGQGTGLGLATVYGIVKQSGGFIWVYSELGQGTIFKIYLPCWAEVREEQSEPVAPAPLRGSETVLVVEDEESVRELTAQFLRSSGYHTLLARDGMNAMEICRSYSGPIQLLITDMVMPGMAGQDLALQFGLVRPETRILFVSGYSDVAIVHHGLINSDAAFLEKPFTHAQLAQRIRAILDTPLAEESSLPREKRELPRPARS